MAIRELRIHGVGGSPGERLLGLSHPDQAVVVGEGIDTVFLARRGKRRVEGYDWGGLTSGSRWQPLWVLLLPFTLLNVAGWTHPAFDRLRPGRLRALRLLVHVSAGLLTAAWTVWLSIVTVDHLGYQLMGAWLDARVGFDGRVAGTVLGFLAALAGMGVLGAIAASSAKSLEAPDGEAGTGAASDAEVAPDAEVAADDLSHLDPVPVSGWSPQEDLSSPSFFRHEQRMNERLAWHLGVVLITALVLLAKAAAAWGDEQLLLGEVFVVVGALQLATIGVLAVVSWPRDTSPTSDTPVPPPALPAVAVTVAVALTNGFFAGLTLLVGELHGDPGPPWGPELALIDGFVWALGIWGVLTALWVLRRRAAGDASELPQRSSGLGQEYDGVSDRLRKRTAHARGLAITGHRATRPLSWFAALFLLAGLAVGAGRIDIDGQLLTPWTWLNAPTDTGGIVSATMSVATWLLPLVPLGAVLLVWRSTRAKHLRRGVGIIWDVLTFWPRRYHPLAVRPYTDRAVPEFRARVEHLVGAHDGLLVSAHSQGTVIAAAALASLDDDRVSRVALLTYGSPLATLYAQAFPAYFGDQARRALHGRLAAEDAWCNLWRRTDPIGGRVLDDDDGVDVHCPDPAEGPPSSERPEDDPDPEPLRRAWIELCGHSYFYRESAYKDARRHLLAMLAAEPDVEVQDTEVADANERGDHDPDRGDDRDSGDGGDDGDEQFDRIDLIELPDPSADVGSRRRTSGDGSDPGTA